MFYTITNLQGSQTLRTHSMVKISFTPLQTYKVLKRISQTYDLQGCFTPLQTYKVLKPAMGQTPEETRFTPLQTYKVLKHRQDLYNFTCCFTPLQTYKVLKPVA